MTNIEKFRPGSAIASGWVLIFFFSGFIAQTFFYGGDILATVAICAAGITASYLLFLKPYLLIFDEGIKIVNPTKEITASWNLINEIETRYTMSLVINGVTYYAWAAPAPSGRHSRRMHKTDLHPGAEAPRRVGDSLQSDSGAAAYIAKLRKRDFAVASETNFQIVSNPYLVYLCAAFALIGLASLLI
jgi:hypothetical protein